MKGEALRDLLRDLKRELSNARIAASGMNDDSIHWLIGNKYYEPEKISVFVKTIWDKVKVLESTADLAVEKEPLLQCVELSREIANDVRVVKSEMREQGDVTLLATRLFFNLKALSSNFFGLYFEVKRNQVRNQGLGE